MCDRAKRGKSCAMTQSILRKALLEARVPRYTSYPPATRFSQAVGADQHAAWLSTLPATEPVSLYAHIPFCRRLCWFCACRTQGTSNAAPLTRFLQTLNAEMRLVETAIGRRQTVSALHLGGGTPTLMEAFQIKALSDAFRAHFDLSQDPEISVEIDPTELDETRLDALVDFGLNRASIGVQDFDPKVQEAIGRLQSAEITAEAVTGLRVRGVKSVNFDLLYGLPYQTPERLSATLAKVLDHKPDRLALYGYAHVPWVAKRQKLIPEEALPDPSARRELAELAQATLVAAGYVPIGIDHYALPKDSMARSAEAGTLRRNFQGYTTDTASALISMGPSAISRFEGGYSQNASATRDWTRAVETGLFATSRGFTLSREDIMVADAIERLMCDGRIDFARMAERHGLRAQALRDRAEAALADLPEIGTLSGDRLAINEMAYARLLAARLDPELESSDGRFSLAS
ncbi:Oxygen-independent coproporphyrinogen-III oxidase [Roseivivax sp. THAF30]|nr:Oxygen-independent coproporphyrinogen-III oxidase [Roseivivax sp. THAF30]